MRKVVGGQTTVYVGTTYEKNLTTGVVTKYYYLGGQRVAMRAGSNVTWIHGDHLGSASLTTNASGAVAGEMRYYPYGQTRWGTGTVPTDRRYTGQREETGLGLYDYGARYYDPLLGRFIQADTIVPEPGNPQSLNRYSYVNNNPLRYVDPTGHITEDEQTAAADYLTQLLLYDIKLAPDWGWSGPFWAKRWNEGLWTLAELDIVLQAVQGLAQAMGGADAFRANLGGAEIVQRAMDHAGLGKAHKVVLNEANFTEWTVAHELGHAWDGVNGGRLSRDMQKELGAGYANPILHLLNPEEPAYWYDTGQGPPPCGIDANFNRKEDFAEAVTAYVYPQEASRRADQRGWSYVDLDRGYAYPDFGATPRGQYISALMVVSP